MDQQTSGIPVRSGIPRPTSRLPVLKSSGGQSQLRSPASTEQLRKKPSVTSLSRTSQPPPTLQKKSSVSSLSSRASQPPPSLQKKTSRASLLRSSVSSISTGPSTGTTSNRASAISTAKRTVPGGGQARTTSSDYSFKKPLARPPSRQTRAIPTPSSASTTASGDDVLGDLDAFRSASRASSRAGSRAGFRETEPDYTVLEEQTEPVKPAKATPRKSRPSLSERTIESLSQLPSSPAAGKTRRRSSFFNADNSMPPPLRPASALSNGRPMTSDGTPRALPSTPSKYGSLASKGSMTAPGKRSISAAMTTSAVATPSKTPSLARPASTFNKQPLSQTQNVPATARSRPLSNSKTMTARTPKARPSLAGTFGQAISPPGNTIATTPPPAQKGSAVNKTTPATSRKVSGSSTALRDQIAKAKAARRSDIAPTPEDTPPKVSSSQALREQIAKAREAAKRANAPREPRTITPPREAIVPDPAEIAGFDFGLEDPFNQGPKGGKSVMRKRLDGARADGRLNVAAMGLSELPDEILNMYKYDPDDKTVAWGEVVDLTVLIAADNELQSLPEQMFPDVDYELAAESDEDGPQFGGIMNLDLHGNILRELPTGLRRLTQLSKLNLSRNNLSLDALDVVTHITTLRELKLSENGLEGAFPASLESLDKLEILELQGNKLTSLPAEIRALVQLRTLNVSDNKLSALPAELFTSTSVVELIASKNAFSGSFFDVDAAPYLQKLLLSSNSLTDLCRSGTISLPALKHLDMSANRLSTLPDMSSWTSLSTLLLGENNLSELPEGFLSLQQLRNADFTGNNLNKLDERIALMEVLENLTLAANPLRDRKFLTMGTEDIKRDLRARIEPEADEDTPAILEGMDDDDALAVNGWKLKPSGTLDLSFQNLTEVDEEAVAAFAARNDVRQLYLQQNYLTTIPLVTGQLSFLSVLDLSKNSIINPLSGSLELPRLRELRLNSNKIQSLDDVTAHLLAPNLQQLDVSNNRLTGALPPLREFFPGLLLLIASDNSITEVSAESLQGLKTVNLSNNDIGRLDPHIGLHIGTLTSLDVDGNKFRVPNHAVLKKGTDAVLSWLKDKIPSPTEEFFTPGSPGY